MKLVLPHPLWLVLSEKSEFFCVQKISAVTSKRLPPSAFFNQSLRPQSSAICSLTLKTVTCDPWRKTACDHLLRHLYKYVLPPPRRLRPAHWRLFCTRKVLWWGFLPRSMILDVRTPAVNLSDIQSNLSPPISSDLFPLSIRIFFV